MGAILCASSFLHSLRKNKDSINESFSTTKISRFFKLQRRNTTLTQEFIAATATFLTMSYIITVNATILSDSGATCSVTDCTVSSPTCALTSDSGYLSCIHRVKNDLIVATAVSSMAASLAMGVFANLPLALAPGMGANAYLAYQVVGFHGSGSISYESALAVVFLEGCVFFVMAVVGMRAKIGRFIPRSVRLGSAAGIGLFIAFVGMQSHQGIGLVGPDPSTLVTLAACDAVDSVGGACTGHRLRSPTFWLGVAGFLVICYCLMKNIKGSMVYGIALVTAVSWIRGTKLTIFPYTNEGEASFQYFKKVIDFHKIESTAGALSFKGFQKGNVWVAFFTLLYVDILSTTGTLYTMAELAGFSVYNLEGGEEAGFEGEYAAYMVDAGATVAGAALGVSPIAVYVESSAGIKEGGRTGLTAVFVGIYFFFSLFFVPLLASVPPWAVGGPLIVVGVMMMKVVKDVEWENVREGVCAFVTMALMPLTYSISNGIVGGIGVWMVLGGFDYVVGRVKLLIKVREVVADDHKFVSAAAGVGGGDRTTPDVIQTV